MKQTRRFIEMQTHFDKYSSAIRGFRIISCYLQEMRETAEPISKATNF
jgi:hypothetical protein